MKTQKRIVRSQRIWKRYYKMIATPSQITARKVIIRSLNFSNNVLNKQKKKNKIKRCKFIKKVLLLLIVVRSPRNKSLNRQYSNQFLSAVVPEIHPQRYFLMRSMIICKLRQVVVKMLRGNHNLKYALVRAVLHINKWVASSQQAAPASPTEVRATEEVSHAFTEVVAALQCIAYQEEPIQEIIL